MSAVEADGAVLTREELDALLASVSGEAAGEDATRRSTRPSRGRAVSPPRPGPLGPLLRSLDEFGAEQSRALSTLYQTTVGFALSDWEEVTPRELASSLLETDRVVTLELEPGGQRGYLVISRALLFGWLSLAFGAPPSVGASSLPERGYTRIEERFLIRAAEEVRGQLEKSWRSRHGVRAALGAVEEPGALAGDGRSVLLVASFHADGIGELSRLRVALPPAAFDAVETETVRGGQPFGSELRRTLLEMPVRLRVEAGTAELSLAQISRLEPGDVIALDRSDAHGLLVRLEQSAKFRAERGSLGGRLAVQITERL